MSKAWIIICKPWVLLLWAGTLGLGCAHPGQPVTPDPEFAAAAQWTCGEAPIGWNRIDNRIRAAARPAQLAGIEKQLILLLRSEATDDARREACRRLGKIGGKEAVPVLATALLDPALAEHARGALQAIPARDAERVLIHALKETQGGTRLGVINSLGVRRDPLAVRALGRELNSLDVATSVAAAHALAQIGTRPAMRRLARVFSKAHAPLQREIMDALLIEADRLAAASYTLRAAKIYEQLYTSEKVPTPMRMTALRGLARISPERWTEDVLARAGDPHPDVGAPAARLLVQLPGEEVAPRAVARLASYPPPQRAQVLLALGERGDPAARDAALAALNDEDQQVRFAAITALAGLGDAATVPTLIQVAAEGPDAQCKAAARTLTRMRAAGVDEMLGAIAVKADLTESEHVCAVEALAARKAGQHVDAVLQLAAAGNPAEQIAAFKALQQLATPGDQPLRDLIALRLKAPTQEVADAGNAAIAAVAARMSTSDAGQHAMLAAWQAASTERDRVALLGLMPKLGGARALAAARAATLDTSPVVAEAAVRALTAWPTPDAIPLLLEIAKTGAAPTLRILALQGVIRLTNAEKEQTPAVRIQWLTAAFALAARPEEKKAALEIAGNIPDDAALAFVMESIGDPAVGTEAATAAVRLIADPVVKSVDLKQTAQARLAGTQK